MIGGLMKIAALAATSAVILPYIAALLCNLAYGWPQVRHKYRRAFSPRKVYALNLCIIQSLLLSLRYATLYVQWKAYYKSATASEVMKVNYVYVLRVAHGTKSRKSCNMLLLVFHQQK